VIGSDRGGIPETLGAAGLTFPVPDRLSPSCLELPTPEEVMPWVEAIVALWDSLGLYEAASQGTRVESQRWAPEALEPGYEQFFARIGSQKS
jgi:hypothetical protein